MMLHRADKLLKGFKWLWQNCAIQKQFQCPSPTHLITSHCSSHMETDTSMNRAERVGEAILTALTDSSHYERALPSVHSSVSKPAPARLPAELPAPGSHTWLLNGHLQWWQQQGHSADIYLNISPTSRYAVQSPHFLHSPQKKRIFPPKLTDLEKPISSLCLHGPRCFCANYNAFSIHREKGGPERNL